MKKKTKKNEDGKPPIDFYDEDKESMNSSFGDDEHYEADDDD